MKSYKSSAWFFMITVWILGVVVSTGLLLHSDYSPQKHVSSTHIALIMLLAALFGASKVRLTRSSRFEKSSSVSLGAMITFFALIYSGVHGCVLVGITSALSAALYPHRQPLFQLLHNVSTIALSASAAGLTYHYLYPEMQTTPLNHIFILSLLISAMVYFLVNTFLVATAMALCADQSIWKLWRTSFLWTAPSNLAGASISAIVLQLYHGGLNIIMYHYNINVILLMLPIFGFFYQTFRMYSDKAEEKEQHIIALEGGKKALADLYLSTVRSLATAIDAKDQSTHAHIQRVHRFAVSIADQMQVKGDELEAIRTGALLHDIGKLGVPDYVLLKPSALSVDEFEKMKRHTAIGAAILEQVPFPWPVATLVLHHHERWDGAGYPDNLAGTDIPRGARILAVADVYDALTSDRPYRPAWSASRARAFIQAGSGSQFDPDVVDAFMAVADRSEDSVLDLEIDEHRFVSEDATQIIRRSGAELWALYEVSQVLNANLGMEDRLKQLGNRIAAIFPGAECSYLLLNPHATMESGSLDSNIVIGAGSASYLAEIWSFTERSDDSTLLHTPCVIKSESIAAIVTQDNLPYRGPCQKEGMLSPPSKNYLPVSNSALIVPLIHMGKALGSINLFHPSNEAFTLDDEHLMQMIAEQVQSALYHDILFDRTLSDSITDALTGLYNSRYLDQSVSPMLKDLAASEHPSTLTLLYLDLDNFKPINDQFGHQHGNVVLQNVARLFQRELRPKDLVVRYGGDEFLIVLHQTDSESAVRVSNRIRRAVKEYESGLIQSDGKELRLDISIGAASFPQDGSDLNNLVFAADQRMYAEKANRKHGILKDSENRIAIRSGLLPPVLENSVHEG